MKKISAALPLSWAAFVVATDQLTKWLVMRTFEPYEVLPVIPGFFNLTFITNTGAAFGMFAGAESVWRQVFFLVVGAAALIILFFAFHHYRRQGLLYVVALGLIGGGAVGNMIDRIRFGSVVDFLDFYIQGYHWPAFNVADSAITVGVGLFLLASFLEEKKKHSAGDRKLTF